VFKAKDGSVNMRNKPEAVVNFMRVLGFPEIAADLVSKK